ncbi:TrbG/VirB9 family P-type conjugative transfer protein, partial [Salmonella enterica]|nr:TrbG/VirB9 family P-type conjugative transfer protein [Salmonella enterica]
PVESPFVGRDLNQNPCSGNQNRRYEKKGDLAISPSEVWDNGTFTCMRFPTNAPRPVVYEVLPDGTETLVNSHTVNDILVIHSVSTMYKLRLNKLVLAVRTSVNNTGYYNYNGTTTGEIREVKNDRK